MGYYANGSGHIEILDEEKAYRAMCNLNKRDNLKSGGSWGPGRKKNAVWFSWMPEDYPSETETAKDILELLGFHFYNGNEVSYDSKVGQEKLFLEAIAPYANIELEWQGEDGHMWKHVTKDGRLETKSANITWES